MMAVAEYDKQLPYTTHGTRTAAYSPSARH